MRSLETFYDSGNPKTTTFFDSDGGKVGEFEFWDTVPNKFTGSIMYHRTWHKNGALCTVQGFDENGHMVMWNRWDKNGKPD